MQKRTRNVGENKSVRCWLSIMNGLRNHGVEDILDCLCGWVFRFSVSDKSRISKNRSAAMHHSSDS